MMTTPKKISLFGIILLLILTTIFYIRSEKATTSTSENSVSILAHIDPASVPDPVHRLGPPKVENSEFSRLTLPKVSDIRAEAEQDPHSTPPALIEFGRRLGEAMSAAKKSPANARAFMNELDDCVSPGEEKPESAQAQCISNAETISRLYPELSAHYEKLRGTAEPRALKLFELSKKLSD